MLKQRLQALFKEFDPTLRQIVQEVGELEQRYISMQNPRGIMDDIDEILTRIATQELEKKETDQEAS